MDHHVIETCDVAITRHGGGPVRVGDDRRLDRVPVHERQVHVRVVFGAGEQLEQFHTELFRGADAGGRIGRAARDGLHPGHDLRQVAKAVDRVLPGIRRAGDVAIRGSQPRMRQA